ncbi:unnamed protein product [Acanthoscelides obtectus]|uniref:Uncharacterized protein n=1 Tax=Acanthoscelides obtectus TaxID=200917 RepID=A0A9P0JZ96_ACAOB|nr:unnamed protein product [Acanthoscelides obtectus]CAK1669676.1 hypothetical protein AOBTE_LOCUS27161 [Acanthoscelides obtectus]
MIASRQDITHPQVNSSQQPITTTTSHLYPNMVHSYPNISHSYQNIPIQTLSHQTKSSALPKSQQAFSTMPNTQVETLQPVPATSNAHSVRQFYESIGEDTGQYTVVENVAGDIAVKVMLSTLVKGVSSSTRTKEHFNDTKNTNVKDRGNSSVQRVLTLIHNVENLQMDRFAKRHLRCECHKDRKWTSPFCKRFFKHRFKDVNSMPSMLEDLQELQHTKGSLEVGLWNR